MFEGFFWSRNYLFHLVTVFLFVSGILLTYCCFVLFLFFPLEISFGCLLILKKKKEEWMETKYMWVGDSLSARMGRDYLQTQKPTCVCVCVHACVGLVFHFQKKLPVHLRGKGVGQGVISLIVTLGLGRKESKTTSYIVFQLFFLPIFNHPFLLTLNPKILWDCLIFCWIH